MVIIAVASIGEKGLNDIVNPRFGRAMFFTFITLEKNDEIKAVKIVPHHIAKDMGSAGIIAAKIIGTNNADIILTKHLGPNAFNTLNSFGVEIFILPEQELTIKQSIELYIEKKLSTFTESDVEPQLGTED